MLIGCGAFLTIILMIVGGVFYEELMMRIGPGAARAVIIVLSCLMVAALVKLVTARAPADG